MDETDRGSVDQVIENRVEPIGRTVRPRTNDARVRSGYEGEREWI